jgi:hypothetical protein
MIRGQLFRKTIDLLTGVAVRFKNCEESSGYRIDFLSYIFLSDHWRVVYVRSDYSPYRYTA